VARAKDGTRRADARPDPQRTVEDGWAPAPPPWPAPKPPPPASDGGPIIQLRFDERGVAPAAGNDDAAIVDVPALADYARQLRDRVAEAWHPLTALHADLGLEDVGAGAGRKTLVRVRIDRAGRLLRSDVDEPSGLPSFDHEARRALQTAQLPAPPAHLLDDLGEVGLRFELRLDLGVSAFLARLRRDVFTRWQPAPAFQKFARPDQITAVRVLIAAEGVITQSHLDLSSGIHHLDDSALAATRPGTRVPTPPPALCPAGAPLSLRLEFVPDVSGHGTIRITREATPLR
jgi:TonB family protein